MSGMCYMYILKHSCTVRIYVYVYVRAFAELDRFIIHQYEGINYLEYLNRYLNSVLEVMVKVRYM